MGLWVIKRDDPRVAYLEKKDKRLSTVFDAVGDTLGDSYAYSLHCHFSKIEYTDKGEKKHLTFEDTVFGPPPEPLMECIAREKLSPRIICESAGTQAEDALYMKRCYEQYLK